jgi:site-specific DNA-methyltransferase (adenine-specific)/adenine-specific DNA-methyltransferase
MPTLDWIGKKAVVNHHQEVPYRLIHCNGALSAGDVEAGNLLIEGDNLVALKALLPYYAGKVKCIYIDPPYNTGNEGWVYNDNVNSPEIKKWLGEVVGREAEDLSRHDKWLCMMYPRLRLLKEFLHEDGSIWMSIDDYEGHNLRSLADEIFGRNNFVATFVWEKDKGGRGDADVSSSHDYIIVYANDRERWANARNLLARSEVQLGRFKNPDNDPRGPWRQGDDGTAKSGGDKQKFPITLPSGRTVIPKRYWAFSKQTFDQAVAEGRAYFGRKGNSLPIIKRYLSEVREGVAPRTWLPAEDVGTNQSAKRDHLRKILPDLEPFDTPKPEGLVKRAIEIASNPGDIVLDSFVGSGTTAACALKMKRRWIAVEMEKQAASYAIPRLKKVIEGTDDGGISQEMEWEGGGGFRYCTLGHALFDGDGGISPSVSFPDLAAHVFFAETGQPIPKKAREGDPFLGTFQNRAVYLLWSRKGASDPGAHAANILSVDSLAALPSPGREFTKARIVYADGCTVSRERLARDNILFKQVPYRVAGN